MNSLVKKDNPQWVTQVLSGGDDYQLCFTFAPEDLEKLPANCSIIGQIGCGTGVKVFKGNQEIPTENKGFVHFSNITS